MSAAEGHKGKENREKRKKATKEGQVVVRGGCGERCGERKGKKILWNISLAKSDKALYNANVYKGKKFPVKEDM